MNDKKRNIQIRVCVNQSEKDQIEATLKNVASHSTSSFLRTLGLSHEPKSIIDAKSVLALCKINADQGRLGGLLKLLLSNKKQITPETINKTNALLIEIEKVQAELLHAARRL